MEAMTLEREWLASYLDDNGWHNEAANVRNGIDLWSYETDLRLIDWLRRHAHLAQAVDVGAELFVRCKQCNGHGQAYVVVSTTPGNFMDPPEDHRDLDACPSCDGAGFTRAHLAQPAQAVDVEKVAAVGYEAWMDDPGLWLHANNMERSRWTKIAQAIITRALSGEKAGPVGDGLRFPEWVIESLGVLDAETQRLYLDPTDGNKVGLNERCAITFFKRFATDPEEACRMYGTLTASPTPDKEGA